MADVTVEADVTVMTDVDVVVDSDANITDIGNSVATTPPTTGESDTVSQLAIQCFPKI